MLNKTKTRLTTTEWLSMEYCHVARYFEYTGFNTIQDILVMRVFDLMNVSLINAIRAEEIITCLYLYLNPNIPEDISMCQGLMKQSFNYTEWRKIHRKLEKITVADLVLTEGINLKAIQHFYDAIRKKFFKSSEYNPFSYRFRNKAEYLTELARRKKEATYE